MPRYEITAPDGRRFEVTAPDGASQQDVMAYAQKNYAQNQPDAPADPTDGMTGGEKFFAGMGKGMVDLGRGIGQRVGLVSDQDVADARKRDEPLMKTGAGAVGDFAGNVVGAAPALMVPGANTVAGAGLVGAGLGFLQPTTGDESALKNAAIGAAGGAGGQAVLGKLAGYAGSRLAAAESGAASAASKNSIRDATLRASQDAGYVVPPSMADAGIVGRTLEGVSGKFKTNQAMAVKNQNVTDSLARKAIGLAEDQPISKEALQHVRTQAAAKGYEPLKALENIPTDSAYQSAIKGLTSRADSAAKDFPTIASDVKPLADGLAGVKSFSGSSAVDQISVLREKAGDAYAQGNKSLGKAYKGAAEAIESQIERFLGAQGKDGAQALKNFREARTTIAKTYSVESALQAEGGKVNAKVFGAALQRGKPLSDELKTIGAFANNFGEVAGVPQSGWTNPITALDAFGAAGMAGAGAGLGAVALPAARLASRALIQSKPYQQNFVRPDYAPGMLTRLSPKMLKELEDLGMGGLLGPSIYAAQQ